MKKGPRVMELGIGLWLSALMIMAGCSKSFNVPSAPGDLTKPDPGLLSTFTPANSPTATFTASYTSTSSVAATTTATSISSVPVASTPSLSGTPTISLTVTPTASPTATPTFTSTLTASFTPTASPTATLTSVNSPTPSSTSTNTPGPFGWVEANASAAFGQRMFSGNMVYNNRMWLIGGGTDCSIIGGVKGDVWSSSDGANWTLATASPAFGTRWGMGTAVFNNKMWVIGGIVTGGYGNDVWSSSDGVNWTRALAAAPFAARQDFGCLVFNNKIWVIGGDNNLGLGSFSDVWSSPDGVNWTQAANFPVSRTGASCVVFNGAMWVIAGGTASSAGGSAYYVNAMNDAWYSTDGSTWTQATANGGFTGRVYASAQVFNNQIWLLGGAGSPYFPTIPNTGVDDDVWVSSDGVHWTQTYPTLPFAKRFAAESYVFNNAFWVAGGGAFVPGNAAYYADVWHNP